MNPLTSVSSPSVDLQSIPDQPTGSAASARSSTGFHLFSYILGALTATLFLGGSLFLLRQPEPPPIALQPPPTPAPTATPLPTATPAPMTVYVSGAVAYPGVYMLSPDARVGDAIESAGGLSTEADPILVNQAEKLWDGAQIHVPNLAVVSPAGGEPAPASRLAGPPAGVSGSSDAVALASSGSGTGGININAASAAELETLPGIGPSKAVAIIENRPYASVDELERVPGIGAKTVAQLRESVVLQ